MLEAFIDFDRELSVVAARGTDGDVRPLRRGRKSPPAPHPRRHHRARPSAAPEAVEIARTVMEKLDAVGVLCVEFFLTRAGDLLINELAPRPHNSGHFTFDACVTSQFEQQLRAVCGLPLGSTEQMRPAAMANLLGEVWAGGTPDWAAACDFQGVKLHLYGKAEARPGRKMGHLTALGPRQSDRPKTVLSARAAMSRRGTDDRLLSSVNLRSLGEA